MVHKIFRSIPSWITVLETLHMMHIPTILPCTFEKDTIYLENSSDAVYILEPYYLQCKVKQFLEYTNAKRWVTIFRHILHPYGWEIKSKEITRNTVKILLYTIQRNSNEVVTSIDVNFL